MLEELSIKNFAIIDELTISFNMGLTVLTGETGAGKSIIIDAIGLLIGGRGSVEFVRHGKKRAEIEGLFHVTPHHPVRKKLEETGIEVEDEMVVLRRDITNHGKSICRINGKLVTLAILRETGRSLVDIHGQHEHQDLMQTEKHLSMLDRFAGPSLKDTLQDYRKRYETFTKRKNELEKYKENDKEAASRLDFIQFQLREIEQARLTPGEDEELEKESFLLANSEKLFTELTRAYDSLYGERKALDWAGQAMAHGEEAAGIDEELSKITESLQGAYYTLEEVTFALREKVDSLTFDPERLNEVETRLDEIKKLKRKYGQSVTEILEFAAQLEEEMESLTNKDEKIEQLERELESLALDLQTEADTLTDLRKQAADKLTDSVEKELKELHMKKAVMKADVHQISRGISVQIGQKTITFNENGQDKIEFLLSPNAGEPLKPLAKIASGGEISRIMLAMKTILSGFQDVTSLIFDEVDTGVSGRVAQSIGEKIYKVSEGSQVLCITHLPQVAAMADQHLYIEKKEKSDRVITNVVPLEHERKTEEIARMISGVEVTELTKQNARELLQMAEKIKSNS
ncbi:DNA repair protein RecN [Alteribacillus iranensis]|uniref:DNA repair protein RecN n=1 Tax=Alteribacillus iranensis TaxID=930128 RepID=A0A1I1ZHM0_9BACI|nr:DNA repair protein RecN [Alteribacillus iranensis]SFE31324.1 DNA replication and repair protein RecN [Alteribacillus iranensis]